MTAMGFSYTMKLNDSRGIPVEISVRQGNEPRTLSEGLANHLVLGVGGHFELVAKCFGPDCRRNLG